MPEEAKSPAEGQPQGSKNGGVFMVGHTSSTVKRRTDPFDAPSTENWFASSLLPGYLILYFHWLQNIDQ